MRTQKSTSFIHPNSPKKSGQSLAYCLRAHLTTVDFILGFIVFISYLALPNFLCAGAFCGADSYWYHQSLQTGDWIHQGSGVLVFLPMAAFNVVTGPIWAIYLTSALLSALFFIAFTRLAQTVLHHPLLARLLAIFAVWSFWWMRIALELYKNEMAIVLLLFTILFLWHPPTWLRKTGRPALDTLVAGRSIGWWLAAFALGLLLALVHLSTLFFIVLAILFYIVWHFISSKQLLFAALSTLALVLLLAAANQVSHALPEYQDPLYVYLNAPSSWADQSVYLLALPAAIAGLYALRQRLGAPFAAATGAILLSALILGFSPIFLPDWQWRFLLDAFWVLLLLLTAATIASVSALNSKKLPLSRLLLHALVLTMVFFTLVAILSLDASEWMAVRPLYSPSDLTDLQHILSTVPARQYYVPTHDWSLAQRVRMSGFNGSIQGGYCPCNGSVSHGTYQIDIPPKTQFLISHPTAEQLANANALLAHQTRCAGPAQSFGAFTVSACR